MEDITNENIEMFADFYNKLGVDPEQFFSGKNITNIFDFLNIVPQVDELGNRKLTSYEILGLLPNIENGKEKPIIFFMKNKFRGLKIVKPKFELDLFFSKAANEKDESLIDYVVNNYKTAIMQNNLAEAERQFEMLDKITGGKAKHYIGKVYDYTKFYKQMKKQLLIDIFSHFFMIYLMRKKSIIKEGLIIKNKKYRAYESYKKTPSVKQEKPTRPEIKSIKIDSVKGTGDKLSTEKPNVIEMDLNKELAQFEKKIEKINEQSLEVKIEIEKPQIKIEQKSFLKKIKTKLFRKNKKINLPKSDQQKNIKMFEQPKFEEEEVSYE